MDLKKSKTIINTGKSHDSLANKINQLNSDLDDCISNHTEESNLFLNYFGKMEKFIEDNFGQSKSHRVDSIKSDTNSKSKNKNKKKSDIDVSEEVSSKMPSMKTASDVVKRIIWDTGIDRDYITVGYLDRFVGLKECTFNTFEWGDIVEADLNSLAIPKHRISYFKYKGEKIWDKSTRLDNFFGSVGSNTTIYEVIEKMENVQFNHENLEEEKLNKLGRVKVKNEPNFFVSIPITNRELLNNIKKLNDDLQTSNHLVNQFMMPDSSYHVTLCTLRVDGEEELKKAKQALESIKNTDNFASNFLPIQLKFSGISDFYNKVFHVKCECPDLDKLERLKKLILEKFKEFEVNLAGNYYEFIPHLTIFKISGSNPESKNQQVCLLIDNLTWMKYEEFDFGCQNVKELELWEMVKNIRSCLTYPVEFTLKLENQKENLFL